MIYTPCLGPKGPAHAEISKDVAGNSMLGMLVFSPGKLPIGTVPRPVETQYFRHLTGFVDEPRCVDETSRLFMSRDYTKENCAARIEVYTRCRIRRFPRYLYLDGRVGCGGTAYACRCRLSRLCLSMPPPTFLYPPGLLSKISTWRGKTAPHMSMFCQ
jgi:hypothetical protein